ncbi:KOW domain-containing RNA-binding protein [Cohnella sp. REN36]|uniref:KOW domain-containing RNA-binding protein n=1 Tax=Cohnella sp. REN36 TaxID=2887347 RepID=UPI001D15422C|nr:KOW domain-containing RNA-binding protein [Cohnella sp. REN36]MCC3376627.1 KOW domain-containing RNA-binding protein [Cohnella sp. REN36]
MADSSKLSPGELVRSRRGKDEGQIAVVIALADERFALVADGDKRRFDRPKRKNVLHLEPLGIVNDEVANSLRDTGRVTNGKLRFAVQSVQRRLEAHAEEKGE